VNLGKIMAMTDPLQALVSLQAAIRKGMATSCRKYRSVRVLVEEIDGRVRCTYARIEHGRVKALAMFVSVDQIDGAACFQIGYAVPEAYRGRGWATEILHQAWTLSHGLVRHGAKQFYVEAVVGISNVASIRVATKFLSDSRVPTTDSVSGEPALAFTRLVTC
jgi:hypothetical protein